MTLQFNENIDVKIAKIRKAIDILRRRKSLKTENENQQFWAIRQSTTSINDFLKILNQEKEKNANKKLTKKHRKVTKVKRTDGNNNVEISEDSEEWTEDENLNEDLQSVVISRLMSRKHPIFKHLRICTKNISLQ